MTALGLRLYAQSGTGSDKIIEAMMQAVAGAKVKPEPSWPPAMYKLSQPVTGPMIGPFREKGRKPTLPDKIPNE